MALFAPHETETLIAELEARKRSAWACYATAIEGLESESYEVVERDAWAVLQAELRTIEAERRDVIAFTE